MVQIEYSLPSKDNNDVWTSVICSVGVLFCMVAVVLGIKFKWFKHRLNFQSTSSGLDRHDNAAGVSQKGETIPLQGVFRRKADADAFVDIERPKTLPPIRIRKSELQIPVPARLSRAENPATLSNEISTAKPPNPPPMPVSTVNERDEKRSQKANRSRSSHRPRSEPNQKFEEPSFINPSSSRKKKPEDKTKKSPTSPTPHYSEVQKTKRQNQEKRNRTPSGSREPKTKAQNIAVAAVHKADQTRHFEKLKDDKQGPKSEQNSRITERRPTGYIRPKDDEIAALVELSNRDNSKIVMKLDGFSDDEDDNQNLFEKVKPKPIPEPRKRVSNEFTSQPIASVATKSDSWSAVARHRILTEELTKQHSALKPVMMDVKSGGAAEFRNTMNDSKPRTMRDMKKNQAFSQNERVVLGQEQHDDTEA